MRGFKKKSSLRNNTILRHRHLVAIRKAKKKVAHHRHIEFFSNSAI